MKAFHHLYNLNPKRNIVHRVHSNILLRRLYQTKVLTRPHNIYKEGLHIRSISGQILKKMNNLNKELMVSKSLVIKAQYKSDPHFKPIKIISIEGAANGTQSRIKKDINKKPIRINRLFKHHYLNLEYTRKFALLENNKNEWNLTGIMKCTKFNTKCKSDEKKLMSCSSQKIAFRRYFTCQSFKPSTNTNPTNRVEFFIPSCKSVINS